MLGDPLQDEFALARRAMVERQIRDRGIGDRRVLAAMSAVPRHAFVSADQLSAAYADRPLPIGEGQTISQPFMVAAMAEALLLSGAERVLEIGCGSGYQAAVLSYLSSEVITIETRASLASSARTRLASLGFANIRVVEGDGSFGLSAEAPFDAILVSAAAPRVPQPLAEQLAGGGRLAIPLGDAEHQQVVRVTRRGPHLIAEKLYPCRFVPLVGTYGWPEPFRQVSNG